MNFDEDFGGDLDELALEPSTNVIPFPRMRPDPGVSESWARERDAFNARGQRSLRFRNPLEALDELMRKRTLPTLPYPDQWGELRERCKLYAGEMLGISGPSGGGKTSFAIQIARACAGAATPVLWAPLELDEPEIDLRIVANMTSTHTARIRETWSREQIAHNLTAIVDRWHFIDRCRSVDEQIAAIRAAVRIAKRVYGRAPAVFLDYIGKLARGGGDPRQILADAIESLRALTSEEEIYMVLLSQTSRGNNAVLTGKVELDSAADAIGVSAETAELEHACSVTVALNVFKADDADVLKSHVLVSKARGSGREGREGFEFRKPGGVWHALDHLPATPGEISVEVKKTRKDRPERSPVEAANEINWQRQVQSSTRRKETLVDTLTRHGVVGMKAGAIKKLRGCSNVKQLSVSLEELERAGDIERMPRGGWRIVPKGNR